MKRIFVVIPTFNRKEYLRNVLTDIQNQETHCFSIDVVVVVDGSTDGSIEMLKDDFPLVHCVLGDGIWWYTKSMNMGFQEAIRQSADLVLTMNDDVRLESNYVSNLFSAWKEQANCSIMGSISVTVDEPCKITFSGVKKITWWRYKQVNYIEAFKTVDTDKLTGIKPSAVLPGRGMLIPVISLKALNYFDPNLIQYGSDDDFCLRASKLGFPVFVSYDAVVYSHVELTGAGNPVNKGSIWSLFRSFSNRYSSRHLKKTAKMIARHGGSLLLPITIPIVILGSIKAHLKYKA